MGLGGMIGERFFFFFLPPWEVANHEDYISTCPCPVFLFIESSMSRVVHTMFNTQLNHGFRYIRNRPLTLHINTLFQKLLWAALPQIRRHHMPIPSFQLEIFCFCCWGSSIPTYILLYNSGVSSQVYQLSWRRRLQ